MFAKENGATNLFRASVSHKKKFMKHGNIRSFDAKKYSMLSHFTRAYEANFDMLNTTGNIG